MEFHRHYIICVVSYVMRVISLISQKGGSGKTTVAVHLAVCAHRTGKISAVVDLDPQGSALEWRARRSSPSPEVTAAACERLPELLKQAQNNGAEFVIIDTAPHSDRAAVKAASASDTILIPVRPYVFDMAAVSSTLAVLDLAGARDRAFILLNASPVRGGFADEAESSLAAPVSPLRLHHRVAYAHAVNDGRSVEEYEPKGRAAEEICALYQWLIKRKVKT